MAPTPPTFAGHGVNPCPSRLPLRQQLLRQYAIDRVILRHQHADTALGHPIRKRANAAILSLGGDGCLRLCAT